MNDPADCRLRDLLDALPEPMLVVSADGAVVEINAAMAERLEARRSSLIGRRLEDLVVDPPEHIRRFLDACRGSRSLQAGRLTYSSGGRACAWRTDGALLRPPSSGSHALILLRVTPAEAANRFVALNQKIDELSLELRRRRLVEDELRREHEWLKVTLQSIGDAVVATDTSGRIVFMNAVAEALTGWGAAEAREQPFERVVRFVHEETKLPIPNPLVRVLADGLTMGLANHTLLIAQDGRERPVDDSAAPIRLPDGRLVGAILIFRDVSERRELERRREAVLLGERRAREEADAANRGKDEFLATLSHELRTPLNAVLGWAKLLAGGGLDGPTHGRAIAAILRSATAQAQLVDELLDMSRIILGSLRIEQQPVDLAPAVSAAVESVAPAAAAKGVRLRLQTGRRAVPVMGDSGRLQQIVWNLLTNALKFTPAGGTVLVDLHVTSDQAVIEVTDTGSGIDPAFLPQVFDRFRQSDSSTTRHHGGLGLGLSIVQHLVRSHAGSVEAHSGGDGQGSTFVVRLPLLAQRTEAPRPARREPEGPAVHQQRLHGVRVLVVEDDPEGRELLEVVLRAEGAVVRAVASAAAALAGCREDPPDVLVSDIGLPGEDGFWLVGRIRALDAEYGRRTVALAVTGFVQPEMRSRALRVGFDSCLPKPLDPERLVGAIVDTAAQFPPEPGT